MKLVLERDLVEALVVTFPDRAALLAQPRFSDHVEVGLGGLKNAHTASRQGGIMPTTVAGESPALAFLNTAHHNGRPIPGPIASPRVPPCPAV